jgi:hypothetical protein
MNIRPTTRHALLATALLALAGCASNPRDVPPGASMEQLTERAGPPTARYERNGEQRLEYATGPFGKFTWMVDLDANGKVKSVEQVLTDASFNQIKPHQNAEDVRWALGRPSEVGSTWQGTTMWSYRYDAPHCQWFVVVLEPGGKEVRYGAFMPDPLCAGHSDPARD